MAYALRTIRTSTHDQLSRRLAVISRNSGLSLHFLARIIPEFQVDSMERISLPLNKFLRFVHGLSESPVIQGHLKAMYLFIKRRYF